MNQSYRKPEEDCQTPGILQSISVIGVIIRCIRPFTGTIALLKEAREWTFAELNTENVSGIQITSHPEGNGNRSRTVLYRDAKDLETLIPALNYQDYVWMNDMYYEQTITEASASSSVCGS